MSSNNKKNVIDISLDDILLEQPVGGAIAAAAGAGAHPVPNAAQLQQFINLYRTTLRGVDPGSRAGASVFNRVADRMFGNGVDTRELHDMIHNLLPDADIPGRSALRAGEAFTKAVTGGGGGQAIVKGGKVASGVGKLGAKWTALKTGAGVAGGLGTAGTVALGAAGVAGAALAGRAAWNIWHSKMKPQVDALGSALDELQYRTTKLQSKAFSQAMKGFNQRFDTAMKGAAFRDSDRVILGQAMALIDFYNNLAQSMFKVQKMQAARDISGTGGKVGVAGDSIKIVEQPTIKESLIYNPDYSLQELFGFGRKKAEPEYQTDDTPDETDDDTSNDRTTDSKKDTGQNWESKVNSVFSTLRGGALSGAPSKFTGGIKNMWATIGFKPAKTKLPPEFTPQAIDGMVAGLINTILAPAGAGGAQGTLKLTELATEINECLGGALMEVSAQYDLLVLTEDLKAFMVRTPDLSAIADETAQAAAPPPPAEQKEIQKVVQQVAPAPAPNVSVNVNASATADAKADAKAEAPKEEKPEAAATPEAPKEEPKPEAAPAAAAPAPAAAAPAAAAPAAPAAAVEPAKQEKKAPPPEAVAPAPKAPPEIKLKGKAALMGTYAFGKTWKEIEKMRQTNPKIKIGGPEHRQMWEKELQRIFKTKTLREAVRILQTMFLNEAKPVKMGFGSSTPGTGTGMAAKHYKAQGGAVMRGGQSGFTGNEPLDKAFLDKLWAASFGSWNTNRNRTADDMMQLARDNYSSKGDIVGGGPGVGPGTVDTIGLQARPEQSGESDYIPDTDQLAPAARQKQLDDKKIALKAKLADPATQYKLAAWKAEKAKKAASGTAGPDWNNMATQGSTLGPVDMGQLGGVGLPGTGGIEVPAAGGLTSADEKQLKAAGGEAAIQRWSALSPEQKEKEIESRGGAAGVQQWRQQLASKDARTLANLGQAADAGEEKIDDYAAAVRQIGGLQEAILYKDGSLSFPRYNVVLSREQGKLAFSSGLLQKFGKMLNTKSLLESKINSLLKSKKVIKEGAHLLEVNNKLDVLVAYDREMEKTLNQVANRIRLLNIQYNFR